MPRQKDKVLIIFPRYQPTDSSTYPYWYPVFDQASKRLDIKVLFESGQIPDQHQWRVQRFQAKPINLIERIVVIVLSRIAGYRQVYIHGSVWSAMLVLILKPILSLNVYFWHCEKYTNLPKSCLLRWLLKQVDVLVTGHESVADSYRQVIGRTKPIKIVPNWVGAITRDQSQTVILESTKRKILFVHHLSPRKGSRLLPEIIRSTLARNSDVEFVIVGSGPDLGWLKEHLIGLPVIFCGAQPLDALPAFYRQADYLILPSLIEGFPRVILEAMYYQVPFVSTSVGCVESIVPSEQQNYLVTVGESQDFIDCLQRLLDLRSTTDLVQANYALVIERFTLAKSVAVWEKLFR